MYKRHLRYSSTVSGAVQSVGALMDTTDDVNIGFTMTVLPLYELYIIPYISILCLLYQHFSTSRELNVCVYTSRFFVVNLLALCVRLCAYAASESMTLRIGVTKP